MASLMNNKLPAFIQSHEQAGLYVMQLDSYRSSLLQEKAGGKGGQVKISRDLKKYLEDRSEGGEINQALLEEVHDFLKEVQSKAPRFNIIFASMADESIKRDIVEWFRDNIHKHALLTFRYDRTIAGGMVIRGRNNIFDMSFASKLTNPKKPLNTIINEQPQQK